MIINNLSLQPISFSASYMTFSFRITDYFHETNDAVAWNSDIKLDSSYSINSSTVVFCFADSSALFDYDFFALPDPLITHLRVLCRFSKRTSMQSI